MVKEKTQRIPVSQPSLDWSYLYYLARTKLGFTEEEFWESSIEKINDLINVYGAENSDKLAKRRKKDLAKKASDKTGEIFIDEVGFL